MISFIRKLTTAKKLVDSLPSGDGASGDVPQPSGHDEAEMGFLDHLEEFRMTLFKGMGGMLFFTVVAIFFKDWVIQNILLGPKKPDFISYRIFGIETTEFILQNRTVTGQFFAD